MRNWARNESGLMRSTLSVKISSVYTLGCRIDRYASSSPPILIGDATDTTIALHALPPPLRTCVERFWVFEGRSMRWLARTHCTPINHETFQSRVMIGHAHLVAILACQAQRNRETISRHHTRALDKPLPPIYATFR